METYTDKNGFSVHKELSIPEFINFKELDVCSEYIHIIPDRQNKELALYRSIDTDNYSNNVRIKTVIQDVSISLTSYDKNDTVNPESFYFTYSEACNILTFLTALKSERSEYTVNFDYIQTNNSDMIDKSNMNQETIILSYETKTGRKNKTFLNGLYKNKVQMFRD